ncbi:MAG: P-loop-containing protein [Thermotogota bacterium]
MKYLVYLLGEPGAGKSTVAECLFRGVPSEAKAEPFAHIIHPRGIELGARRESFSGTDALPMNVQPKVIPMMNDADSELFFAEGDRLANEKFFMACAFARIRIVPFLLKVPHGLAAQRRQARGSNQDPKWIRGRVSKVENLWRDYGATARELDGRLTPEEIVAKMRSAPEVEETATP